MLPTDYTIIETFEKLYEVFILEYEINKEGTLQPSKAGMI